MSETTYPDEELERLSQGTDYPAMAALAKELLEAREIISHAVDRLAMLQVERDADYKDMRRYQAKFIHHDLALRDIMNQAPRRTADWCRRRARMAVEWKDNTPDPLAGVS